MKCFYIAVHCFITHTPYVMPFNLGDGVSYRLTGRIEVIRLKLFLSGEIQGDAAAAVAAVESGLRYVLMMLCARLNLQHTW